MPHSRGWRVAAVLLTACTSAIAQNYQLYQYDIFSVPYPPTSRPAANGTEARSINNHGAVVGYYQFFVPNPNPDGRPRGFSARFAFKRHANGILEYPLRNPEGGYIGGLTQNGADERGGDAFGINNLGTVVGKYGWPGFVLENGQLNSVLMGSQTTLTSINDRGDYIGLYYDGSMHSFAQVDGALVDIVRIPGGGQYVDVRGIGWDRTIVGCDTYRSGFLRGPGGSILIAQLELSQAFTCLTAINNAAGKIVVWIMWTTRNFVWDYPADLPPSQRPPGVTFLHDQVGERPGDPAAARRHRICRQWHQCQRHDCRHSHYQ